MFQLSGNRFVPERLRGKLGPRALALGGALLLEALLLLWLLSLGEAREPRGEPVIVVDFSARDVADDAPTPKPAPEPENEPQPQAEPSAAPTAPVPPPQVMPEPRPAPTPIPLPRLPTIPAEPPAPPAPAPAPPAPSRAYGPPAPRGGSRGSDTERVGTAPNGEPMYAAAWYRRPGDSELSGYLSTASGPGWGLIACRTVPDFRVEDCVGLQEYPQGSNIVRSILAAAWQFRVRPPRRGGQSLVGAWVRIRIDYNLTRE